MVTNKEIEAILRQENLTDIRYTMENITMRLENANFMLEVMKFNIIFNRKQSANNFAATLTETLEKYYLLNRCGIIVSESSLSERGCCYNNTVYSVSIVPSWCAQRLESEFKESPLKSEEDAKTLLLGAPRSTSSSRCTIM